MCSSSAKAVASDGIVDGLPLGRPDLTPEICKDFCDDVEGYDDLNAQFQESLKGGGFCFCRISCDLILDVSGVPFTAVLFPAEADCDELDVFVPPPGGPPPPPPP